jgi:cobalt/nickel transport system permease protein
MPEKIVFFLYIICAAWLVHLQNIFILAAVFILLSLVAWRDFWRLFKKTFFALVIFNGFVSVAYGVLVWLRGENPLEFIALFNLRVFDITFMTLLFSKRINIVVAVSFSKTLTFLLTASLSQIENFRKTFEEFRLALKSRTVKPLKDRKKREFLGAMTLYFFKKSNYNAHEVSLALKARGFFDRVQ